jgi:predicted amidohydrolase
MSKDVLRVAAVQLRSGRQPAANVAEISRLVREAARVGATYVQTPENSTAMDEDKERLRAGSGADDTNARLGTFRDLARELRLWLHIGSMAVALPDSRLANRSILLSPKGDVAACYDKIHMFDVDLGAGESYRESRHFKPGDQAVTADLGALRLGLSICYDLRFAALYRTLAQAGAGLLAVPSAFTVPTGQAHWNVLLRARAIETGSFVVAAAQGGLHENGRRTYGHSMIVSPWGEILAEAGVDIGVITADLHSMDVTKARQRIPALQYERPFEKPTTR